MYREHFVAVVIPAHNEERHVGGVIEDLPAFVDAIILVDDASTDRTAEVAVASGGDKIVVLRRERNGGMGEAIVDGFQAALERGADLVALMDADGQMDGSQLPRLLDPIVEGRADLAKGNRFFSRRSFAGMPAHRVVGNLVLTFLTKAATGYWHMFDSENGYTAISTRMLGRLRLDRLRTGYQFANRFLLALSEAGARVTDVPIPARYGDEESGIHPLRDGLAIVWALFTGFWARVAREYLRRVSLPGMALAVSVIAMIGGAAGLVGIFGADASWRGSVVAALFATGTVALIGFFALDAARKRRPVEIGGDAPRELVTLDLSSGAYESRENERELARREHS